MIFHVVFVIVMVVVVVVIVKVDVVVIVVVIVDFVVVVVVIVHVVVVVVIVVVFIVGVVCIVGVVLCWFLMLSYPFVVFRGVNIGDVSSEFIRHAPYIDSFSRNRITVGSMGFYIANTPMMQPFLCVLIPLINVLRKKNVQK